MAHVVEDGTGLANANSFTTAAEVRAYWADHGDPTVITGASDADLELWSRSATEALCALYGPLWRGSRVTAAQALDFPRAFVRDDEGFLLDNAIVPTRVKQGTALLAKEAGEGDGTTASLLPDIAKPGALASQTQTLGPLSRTQVFLGGQAQAKARPLLDGLLAPLVLAGGTVIRA